MPQPNVFSVDVEDFFHVEAFADVVERSQWDQFPSRVVGNTHRLLDLLASHNVEATFFQNPPGCNVMFGDMCI